MGHRLIGHDKVVSRNAGSLPDSLFQRLIDFYHREPVPRLSPIWKGVTMLYQKPLILALNSGEVGRVREVLENVYVGDVMGGMDISRTQEECSIRFEISAISLGNILGSIPLFSPEQPDALTINVANLVAGAESVLGFELNHPGGGGMLGVEVTGRFIPFKLLDMINVTLALPDKSWVSQPILEIGAGSGMLGYLAAVMSDWDLNGYDVIDLPSTSVIAAYMSAGIFGPEAIWLNGEASTSTAPVRFLGTGISETLSYGLIVNQDSLPEMPEKVALEYVSMVGQKLNRGGFFLSVNHESSLGNQHRVFDMVKSETNLRQVSRNLFFSRPGYLQEVWQKV